MKPDNDLSVLAGNLSSTHRRLALHLGSRWIKGTGFCHRSVGTDLIERGIAESRVHRGERQIRAMPLCWALQSHLLDEDSRHG